MKKLTLALFLGFLCIAVPARAHIAGVVGQAMSRLSLSSPSLEMGSAARAMEPGFLQIYYSEQQVRDLYQLRKRLLCAGSWFSLRYKRATHLAPFRRKMAQFERQYVEHLRAGGERGAPKNILVNLPDTLATMNAVFHFGDIDPNSGFAEFANVGTDLRNKIDFGTVRSIDLLDAFPKVLEPLIEPVREVDPTLGAYLRLKLWQFEQEGHIVHRDLNTVLRGLSDVVHTFFGKEGPLFLPREPHAGLL